MTQGADGCNSAVHMAVIRRAKPTGSYADIHMYTNEFCEESADSRWFLGQDFLAFPQVTVHVRALLIEQPLIGGIDHLV